VRSCRLAAALPLLSLLAAARADAVEVPNVGGKPLVLDVTNTAVVDYHFNNRNDTSLSIATQVDDFYGEWLDRLNIQASWWRLRLGMRLDAAVFYHTLSRDDVASLVADQTKILGANAIARNEYTNDFYRELHSRFRRAIYPAKLFLGYQQPGVDVTLGDFYVQLGRGLVFSARKIDELAVDTTVRGIKVVADRDVGSVHLGATLFAGQMNPLRVDETSGRRLNGEGSPLFFGFPTSGQLQTYDIRSMPGTVISSIDLPRPSYLEDTALGEHLEVGGKGFTIGANGALVLRRSHALDELRCLQQGGKANDSVQMGDTRVNGQCASRFPDFNTTDPSKEHNRIVNMSGSLTVPSILKHGDLYLEVAGQQMGDGHVIEVSGKSKQDLAGYAVYASGGVTGGPVSVSLEGKHYRNYFPLSAHIDTQTAGFGAPEFALVTYSQPPTAEPIYTEIVGGGAPNVCVSGGRGRVDYRYNRETSVYAWLGRYSSWSELPVLHDGEGAKANPVTLDQGCVVTARNRTDTWDTAVGAELGFEKGRTHVKAWVGARVTDYAELTDVTDPALGSAFYREGYVRYDIIKHLAGRFSLQLQGFHRHRFEPLLSPHPWTEGENYTALQWSPHLSLIFGYEYLAKDQCQPGRAATLSQPARAEKNLCHYVNGGVQWRTKNLGAGKSKYVGQLFDAVSVFVGQRRAALRCVSGVCRQFPPFEGARLELTSRF
jgi:hypothetical protein